MKKINTHRLSEMDTLRDRVMALKRHLTKTWRTDFVAEYPEHDKASTPGILSEIMNMRGLKKNESFIELLEKKYLPVKKSKKEVAK